MEDYTAPSFSLGLDLDFDAEPPKEPKPPQVESSIPKQAPQILIDLSSQSTEDEQFQPETLNQQNEQVEFPSPPLKRLKRGPQKHVSYVEKKDPILLSSRFDDDDIEDFSAPEEDPSHGVEHSSKQNHNVCGNPKFTLHGHKVLNTQMVSKPKTCKSTPASNKSIFTNLEANENKQMFPKLTVSPLRKFQLLDSDSDSDDSFVAEDRHGDANEVNAFGKDISKPSQSGMGNQEKRPVSAKTLQTDDLWKDFTTVESVSMQTPALDRFGAEYVTPGKGKKVVDKSTNKDLEGSSKRGKKNLRSSYAEEVSVVPGNWVNTQNRASIPKDAGKRRVHAEFSTGGQWYTGQDGNRVYVSISGEKLTGQIAYKQYRKESGKGFKRTKKKATT